MQEHTRKDICIAHAAMDHATERSGYITGILADLRERGCARIEHTGVPTRSPQRCHYSACDRTLNTCRLGDAGKFIFVVLAKEIV